MDKHKVGQEVRQKPRITQDEFDDHDCHLSEEDGCAVCVQWHEQKDNERRAVDAAMLKIALGNF